MNIDQARELIDGDTVWAKPILTDGFLRPSRKGVVSGVGPRTYKTPDGEDYMWCSFLSNGRYEILPTNHLTAV